MCTDKIIAKAKILAGHLLGLTPDRVTFAEGQFAAPGVEKSLSLAEVAVAAYVAKSLPPGFEPGLEASSFHEPANFTFPFGNPHRRR